jgi:hypothetical protein
VSILPVELFDNQGDDGILANTDAGKVFIGMDVNPEDLGWPGKICKRLQCRDPGLNFDRSFSSVLLIQQ